MAVSAGLPDKKVGVDYSSFAGIVNRERERFKLKELTPDKFKCSIFVQGLTAPEDGEIRTRILIKLEQNPKISLQMVAEECERLENLRHDTARIEKRVAATDLFSLANHAIRIHTYRDLLTNINRSDYSHSQEKLHPGKAGNDVAFFDPDLPLQLRKGNKLHLTTFTEHICQK